MVKNVSMILSPWEFVWKPSPGLAGCKSYRLLPFRLFGNPSCMRRFDRVLRFCYHVILLQCMRDRCQGSSDGGKNNSTVASALASVFCFERAVSRTLPEYLQHTDPVNWTVSLDC